MTPALLVADEAWLAHCKQVFDKKYSVYLVGDDVEIKGRSILLWQNSHSLIDDAKRMALTAEVVKVLGNRTPLEFSTYEELFKWAKDNILYNSALEAQPQKVPAILPADTEVAGASTLQSSGPAAHSHAEGATSGDSHPAAPLEPDDHHTPPLDYDDIPTLEDSEYNYRVPGWVHEIKRGEEPWPEPPDPWGQGKLPTVPEHTQPPAISPFVFDQSRIIGTDPVQIALNARVIAAACLRVGIYVQMQGSAAGADLGRVWRESPILWGAVVGDASVGKGPALDAATHYFRMRSEELRKSNEAEWEDYGRQSKVYDVQMQGYYREAAKNPSLEVPPAPRKPPRERLWTDDVTLESLGRLLTENPRGRIIVLKPELSGWAGSMDAYGNGKTDKDRPAYLSFYDGVERYIDRVAGGSYHVPSFGGNILGGIQPAIMAKVAQKLGSDGMLQRFQIVLAAPQGDGDDSGAYDQAAVRQFHKVIDGLLAMEPRGTINAPQPVMLSHAAAAFVADKRRWLRDAMKAQIDPAINTMLGKWQGLHGRIMITDHCIGDALRGSTVPSPEISLDTAKCSWAWMQEVLWPHALQFYTQTLGGAGGSGYERRFMDYILGRDIKGTITTYWLTQHWTWYADNVNKINARREFWSALEAAGLVRALGGMDRSRTMATTYAINPKISDGRFAEKAAQSAEAVARSIKYGHPAFRAQQQRGKQREPGEDSD